MGLVSKEIPALWNGVSQQPPQARSPTQCAVLDNYWPSVVDGVRDRPPFEHLSKISSSDLSSAHIAFIDRDVNNRFIVVITNGDLKVYDLDGNAKTVTFPQGKDYLSLGPGPLYPAPPRTQFAVVTVADYSFVLNKVVNVDMLDVGDDEEVESSDNYQITGASYADGVNFHDGIFAPQFQYAPNPAAGTFRGTKQALEDLGSVTPIVEGDIWKIQGTDTDNFTSYYVRRTGAVWAETVAPNLRNKLQSSTMPWALVHKADGTFDFAPFSWAPRRVGDEDTNPNPRFVGRTIRDIFFDKNRLGFAVEEGAEFSRIGDYGNFYRMTVLSLLADDTIDIQASEAQVTQIRQAVTFDAGIMLLSERVQFRVTEGGTFSPGTIGLNAATHFPMKWDVKALPFGSDLYFVVENGNYSQLFEYFVRDNATGNDATDITGHVPKYIPAGIRQLVGSVALDTILVPTDGDPHGLYCYRMYWTDETTKVQSAWGRWSFDSDSQFLGGEIIDNAVYGLFKRATGTYLEKAQLEAGALAGDLPMQLFLDRRTTITGTWLSDEGKTEFALPYAVDSSVRDSFRIVRGSAFTDATGAVLSITPSDYEWVDSSHVKVVGQFDDGPVYIGMGYTRRYTFNAQYMRDSRDVAIVGGSLILRNYGVYYQNGAYFRSEIAPYGGTEVVDSAEFVPVEESNFDSETVGAATLVLGAPVFQDGKYSFGVYGDAAVAVASLVNDTPYGCTFTSAEWEGFWNKRSQVLS